jgi:3-phosphoshikimate 1-carboxyvinyltransferase
MTAWSSSSIDSAVPARPVPAGAVVHGVARLPPSKSLTNRAYAVALLADGPVRVERPLDSEDSLSFVRVLDRLGFGLELSRSVSVLTPPARRPAGAVLDCGASGTLLRFLLGVCSTLPGEWRIDGTARLRERPVGPLAAALGALGAEIGFLERPGYAPLVVRGGALRGGRVTLDAGESSQYLSALLFAGQHADAPVEIEVPALASAPYVDLTVDVLSRFGGRVEHPAPERWIAWPSEIRGGAIVVEPDLSAAAYPAAAAALTGGEVLLQNARLDSRQGDRRFLELLRAMGAAVEQESAGVRVTGRSLRALDVDLADVPDQVPTLAVLAPFAHGTTAIRNVGHLRIKESDRLSAMARELGRVGATAYERRDGLEIDGVWAEHAPPEAPVTVESHDDHRIAMSMALVGLRRPGLSIARPGVVAKSWPEFWSELARWTGTEEAAP